MQAFQKMLRGIARRGIARRVCNLFSMLRADLSHGFLLFLLGEARLEALCIRKEPCIKLARLPIFSFQLWPWPLVDRSSGPPLRKVNPPEATPVFLSCVSEHGLIPNVVWKTQETCGASTPVSSNLALSVWSFYVLWICDLSLSFYSVQGPTRNEKTIQIFQPAKPR